MKRTPLSRRKDIRSRSLKRQRLMLLRRRLVTLILAEHPWCERCGAARATEVHELRSRARGGSILDRANCAALCAPCHRAITIHAPGTEAWRHTRQGEAS